MGASGVSYTGCESGDNISLSPLFCGDNGDTSVQEFTLRIDSPCAPGNSICGELIGARPVECAWGTLERNTTVAANTTVKVLEDVVVPVGRSLTINHGCEFRFDGYDNSEAGMDTLKNELLAGGPLTISGTSGSLVKFISADTTPSEGDWWGILAGWMGDSTLTVNYAEVKHSDWGIIAASSDPSVISNSDFAENALTSILSGSNSLELDVFSNTIGIGDDGTGMDLSAADSIAFNELTGTSDSDVGISFVSSVYDTNATTFLHNIIGPLDTGVGFLLSGDSLAVLLENRVTECSEGIRITRGKHLLGSQDGDSDNRLISNTTGIRAEASGGVDCPAPSKIEIHSRNTRLEDYTNGIVAVKVADGGPLRLVDLGTNQEDGVNAFIGGDQAIFSINNTSVCGTIPARGNYFGPNAGAIGGAVDTTGTLPTDPMSFRVDVEPAPRPGLGFLGVTPNPVSASTSILFEIRGERQQVTATVYDVAGRPVRRWPLKLWDVGRHSLEWDGRDENGRPVASGLFFVRLESPGKATLSNRVVVLRHGER